MADDAGRSFFVMQSYAWPVLSGWNSCLT